MPRANRYFLPGHVWHITHRCHKQEFLLKFVKDMGRTEIQQLRRHWIEEALHHNNLERHSCWSESLAVGNESFVGKVNLALELQGRKRTNLGKLGRLCSS